jgi:hypothetical protein
MSSACALSSGCDYFMGPFLTTRDEADSSGKSTRAA